MAELSYQATVWQFRTFRDTMKETILAWQPMMSGEWKVNQSILTSNVSYNVVKLKYLQGNTKLNP